VDLRRIGRLSGTAAGAAPLAAAAVR